ncbi:MAG: hypothetical protein ACI8SJ_001591 [Shewanella sp.]|jgi:hypothetical protein
MYIIDFLMIHNLLGPTVQLIAAAIALYAVIKTQRSSDKRAEKQRQHELQTNDRKERLNKIEPIFNLLIESREFYSELHKTKVISNIGIVRDEITTKALVEDIKNELSNLTENRMRLEMLVNIYTPELKDHFQKYKEASSNISITCWSYTSGSNQELNNAFYDLETRVTNLMQSINELQNSLVKCSQDNEN